MLRATFPQRSAAVDGELTISSTMAMRSLLSAIAALSTPPYSRAAATACACSLQALQGLKPDYGGQLMPELKLRPPKEFAIERLANDARLPEHEICGDCEGPEARCWLRDVAAKEPRAWVTQVKTTSRDHERSRPAAQTKKLIAAATASAKARSREAGHWRRARRRAVLEKPVRAILADTPRRAFRRANNGLAASARPGPRNRRPD